MKINLGSFGFIQLVMLIGWFVTGCKLSLWVALLPMLIGLGAFAVVFLFFLAALILVAM